MARTRAATRRRVAMGPGAAGLLLASADVVAMLVTMVLVANDAFDLLLLAYIPVALGLAGFYRTPAPPYWLDSLPRQLKTLAAPVAAYLVAMSLGAPSQIDAVVVAAIAAPLLTRLVVLALLRSVWRRGYLTERAVIIGSGAVAAGIAKTLDDLPEYGIEVVGCVDEDDPASVGLPYLGHPRELDAILTVTRADRVIVTFLASADSVMVELLRWASSHRVRVDLVPRMFEVATGNAAAHERDHIWGIPIVRLAATPRSSVRWKAKRTFDIVVTAVGVLVALPVLGVLAVLVKRSSPGPILFRQTRIGLDGKPFELLKFRSMTMNHDSDVKWDVSGDARVTPIGRFIRRWSLDELPQLFNVLRGDMSLVGPRPERPAFVDEFSENIPAYGARHRVPVGVTGWSQVNGLRGDTSMEARARFDNAYVEQWSLWRDVIILLRTVVAVLRHPGSA